MPGDTFGSMRGQPLKLCSHGHQAIWYRGGACPFCAALAEIKLLKAERHQCERPPAGTTGGRP